MRTLVLLSRLEKTTATCLITNAQIDSNYAALSSYDVYEDITLLPASIFLSEIVFICDTYDSKYRRLLCNYMQQHAVVQKCEFVMICDTLQCALDGISCVPSVNLLFPNILPEDLQASLLALTKDKPATFSSGHQYLLLDKITLDISGRACSIEMLPMPQVCLVSFGYSDLMPTRDQLESLSLCVNSLVRQIPKLEFLLIGSNALDIFARLDKPSLKYEYLEFCDKECLISLYDSSLFHLGSLGYSMWERAFRLLPSFVIPIAENQLPYVEIGRSLDILRPSEEILLPEFSVTSSLHSMYCGTLRFHRTVRSSVKALYE